MMSKILCILCTKIFFVYIFRYFGISYPGLVIDRKHLIFIMLRPTNTLSFKHTPNSQYFKVVGPLKLLISGPKKFTLEHLQFEILGIEIYKEKYHI